MPKNHIPALGVIGPDNIREAFEGDLNQLRVLLQGAVKNALELSGEEDWWPYIHAVFDEFIVAEHKDGRLLKYPYAVDGTKVSLGTPTEVQKSFEEVAEAITPRGGPVGGAPPLGHTIRGQFIEAAPGKSGVWRIRVIQAGVSGNGNLYSEALLREAAPMFEGVRVFAKSDAEHISGGGKDVRNLIGGLSAATFIDGTPGELQATLTLIEGEGPIATKLKEAWARGLSGLFGFSIVAEARTRIRREAGRTLREAVSFTKINSVDLIVEPAAGGAVIDLVEAQQDTIKIQEAPMSEEQQTTETQTAPAQGAVKVDFQEAPEKQDTSEPLQEAIRMVEARMAMRDRVHASALPDKAKDKLLSLFSNGITTFTEAEVDQAITAEADYIASFTPSGTVHGLGNGRIEITESQGEKAITRLDAFFDLDHKDHAHARSFKECYADVTGDRRVTGRVDHCDQSVMAEALETSSFSKVLGDAINRRMVADYKTGTETDVWRKLVTVGHATDFRNQERVRFGGYGDIPTVNEGAAYAAVTSPSDEKVAFAVTKRGGLETVTLEMIKNDDVSAIRQIPIRMSRAAKRTLAKFALDFLATNMSIYDKKNLFHTAHKNLGSKALDKASLAAGRLAMLSQTEAGSNEKIGIAPKYLWVPHQLEQTAFDLFRRKTENDKDFVQSLGIEVVPVWYWADANNWYLSADPMDIPTIEIAFLDGNEEPELFIQDNPTQGSMFTNDKLTWKLRHIYGGHVIDYRGLYGAIVAGS